MKHQDWQTGGFGLYLHWPFCESKCPYCDFNSHVAARIDQTVWQTAFLAEIDRAGQETGERTLRSVFFGGGTPSLMSPGLVGAMLDRISATWRLANDIEITLEANPSSVEASRFSGYLTAGVNRISIGVQSLRDDALRLLGRRHSANEARRAIQTAMSLFPRVSFDLIYARQGQGVEDWRGELCEAIGYGTSHLSLYQLTVEPGTVFAARHARGGLRNLPGDELSAELYDATQDLCAGSRLEAYEVSNHAKHGEESRHNLIYWNGGDYLGIGPGAHGRLSLDGQRWATECPRDPATWLTAATAGNAELPREALPLREQALEYLMMGMRHTDGIDLSRLTALLGSDVRLEHLQDLVQWDMVALSNDRLKATRQGRLVLNAVIAQVASGFELDAPSTPR